MKRLNAAIRAVLSERLDRTRDLTVETSIVVVNSCKVIKTRVSSDRVKLGWRTVGLAS